MRLETRSKYQCDTCGKIVETKEIGSPLRVVVMGVSSNNLFRMEVCDECLPLAIVDTHVGYIGVLRKWIKKNIRKELS